MPNNQYYTGKNSVDIWSNTAADGSGTPKQPLINSSGQIVVEVATMPAGGTGLTDTELRATPVPISGTVTTGGLTDAQLRAVAVPVSGTVTANTGLSQPLTDTQLRATPVPVSGTVTAAAQPGVDIGDVTLNNATIAVTQSGTWDEVGINDSGNSITVDAPVGTPAFVRLSDGAAAISTLPVSLATAPALVASSANIGDVDVLTIAAGDNNIGNVDIVTMPNVVIGSGTVTAVTSITNTVATKEVRAASTAQTSVADSAASTTILASNANRLGATVSNDSSAVLYLLLGSGAASTTSYSARLVQYAYYEVPFGYTGQLTGIWASDPGDGAARVTEITT